MSNAEDIKHRLARKASYEEGRLAGIEECREALLTFEPSERASFLTVQAGLLHHYTKLSERVKTLHTATVTRYVQACQPSISREESIKSPHIGIIAGRRPRATK